MADNKPTSPPTFQDSQQRTWTINLTLGLIDHIAECAGVDFLGEDAGSSPVVVLLFDRRKLGSVLWAGIERQAVVKGVSREQFIDSLDGDALTAGWGALCDAVVFFTPSESREAVRQDIEAQMVLVEKGAKLLAETYQKLSENEELTEMEGLKSELSALASSATN